MNILKDFDTAIAKTENIPSGFVTEKGCYSSYVSNAAWQDHLSSMSPQHRCEYGDGSGGELEEKKRQTPKDGIICFLQPDDIFVIPGNPWFLF